MFSEEEQTSNKVLFKVRLVYDLRNVNLDRMNCLID